MKLNQLLNTSILIVRVFFIYFALFFSLQGFSQNLVKNWSFEDTTSCPTSVEQIDRAINWFTPRGGGGSSELYSKCNNYDLFLPKIVGVPLNSFGYQNPILGNNYVGISCFWNNYNNYQEYIETCLIQGLNPVINYYIEFWVSLSNESNYAVENIGAYFSTDTLHYSSNITTLIDAQVVHSGGIITDTANWVKVSGYFKPPKDGYQFLTIGNFQPSDSTNKTLVGWHAYDGAYYYIENVVVIDSALQHTIGIKEMAAKPVEVKVYPNPTNGVVNIDIIGQAKGNINIQIFSINGQVVHTQSFSTRNNIRLNTNGLNSGIYFIKVFDNRNLFGVEKLIIQK